MKENYFYKRFVLAIFIWGFCTIGGVVIAQNENPSGKLVAAANREGGLVIYSVLSNKAAAPLVEKFQSLYPSIAVRYDGDSGTSEVNQKFITEFESNQNLADVVWSSAVDLQVKLATDGYAYAYNSSQEKYIPSWAKYKNLVWGSTFEPVVLVYNKNLISESDVPKSHRELQIYLQKNSEKLNKKIALFDPEKSGVGLFFIAQDYILDANVAALYKAMGDVNVQKSGGTGEMLTKINSGEYLIGYNMIGSYAVSRSKKDLSNLGIVYLSDYTPVFSRAAIISKKAKHVNAAMLWIDFLLSPQGQKILADQVYLNSIRADIDSQNTSAVLTKIIGQDAVRPYALNTKLIEHLDANQKSIVLKKWKFDASQQ